MSRLGFSNDFSSFCLTFGNGFSISVVYGFGTYSDNKKDFPTSFADGATMRHARSCSRNIAGTSWCSLPTRNGISTTPRPRRCG
jgi:hypothetical protein